MWPTQQTNIYRILLSLDDGGGGQSSGELSDIGYIFVTTALVTIRNKLMRNVGVLATELYIPRLYVDQHELEIYDGVSTGKYTIGLGQLKMGFCNGREDAISMALTVVNRLMNRLGLSYGNIGRLDVGSESNIDKSKSIKTHLMSLFEKHSCSNVEGVDSVNACYGGTAAIFNVVHWMESTFWDGRLGLVVTTDVAVYKRECSAHSTGGAGAVAILIGPNAPLVYNCGIRTSYMRHTYDFFKPVMFTEYPIFDGKQSIQCYLSSALNCWFNLRKILTTKGLLSSGEAWYNHIDLVAFHSPYARLVVKALAYINDLDKKLTVNNGLNGSTQECSAEYLINHYQDMWTNADETRRVETQMMNDLKSLPVYSSYEKCLYFSKVCGNTYTNSVTVSMLSSIAEHEIDELKGKVMLVFSYGSGLTASMYTMTVGEGESSEFSLDSLKNYLDTFKTGQIESRVKMSPEHYEITLKNREAVIVDPSKLSNCPLNEISDDAFYLESVNDKFMRVYAHKTSNN